MGAKEIETFLSHLAVDRNVATSTHNQALSAILFLYQEVLKKNLPRLKASLGQNNLKDFWHSLAR